MIDEKLIKQADSLVWKNLKNTMVNSDYRECFVCNFIEHITKIVAANYKEPFIDLQPSLSQYEETVKTLFTEPLKERGIIFKKYHETLPDLTFAGRFLGDATKEQEENTFSFKKGDKEVIFAVSSASKIQTIPEIFWGKERFRIAVCLDEENKKLGYQMSFYIDQIPNGMTIPFATIADVIVEIFSFIASIDAKIEILKRRQEKREKKSLFRQTTAKVIIEDFLKERGYRFAVKYGAWKATVGIDLGKGRVAVLGVLYKYLENDLKNIETAVEGMKNALSLFHSTCFLLPNRQLGGGLRFDFDAEGKEVDFDEDNLPF